MSRENPLWGARSDGGAGRPLPSVYAAAYFAVSGSDWAVAFRRYSLDYAADEAAARRRQINIWSGNLDMPWDWHAQHHN